MTFDDLSDRIQAQRQAIQDAVNRRLPVKIGRRATDHVKENFRLGGYVDGGLHPWPETRRQQSGGQDSQYGPLMSRREKLRRSITYVPGEAQVTVGTTVPYAATHNEGATITTHPRVTANMRRFAWAKFFEAGGKSAANASTGSQASFWRALALTKKDRLTVTSVIPRRRFLGLSKELREIIVSTIREEILPIIKQ